MIADMTENRDSTASRVAINFCQGGGVGSIGTGEGGGRGVLGGHTPTSCSAELQPHAVDDHREGRQLGRVWRSYHELEVQLHAQAIPGIQTVVCRGGGKSRGITPVISQAGVGGRGLTTVRGGGDQLPNLLAKVRRRGAAQQVVAPSVRAAHRQGCKGGALLCPDLDARVVPVQVVLELRWCTRGGGGVGAGREGSGPDGTTVGCAGTRQRGHPSAQLARWAASTRQRQLEGNAHGAQWGGRALG
jgi:hypothetical protein